MLQKRYRFEVGGKVIVVDQRYIPASRVKEVEIAPNGDLYDVYLYVESGARALLAKRVREEEAEKVALDVVASLFR